MDAAAAEAGASARATSGAVDAPTRVAASAEAIPDGATTGSALGDGEAGRSGAPVPGGRDASATAGGASAADRVTSAVGTGAPETVRARRGTPRGGGSST